MPTTPTRPDRNTQRHTFAITICGWIVSPVADRSLDDAYDKRGAPGSDKHKRNLALMDYADGAMKRIGCYD